LKAALASAWASREAKLFLALLAICLGITLREPRFLQASNLEQVALSGTLVWIVALGQALLIVGRQIDLSVGAIVASSAFVSALWLSEHPNSSLALMFVIGIAVGTMMGAGNALLAAGLRIPAIVATLGTLAIYRGGIIVFAGGRQISATILPDNYGAVAQTHIMGQSPLVWIALALTFFLGWLARNTRTGRNVYAIGSNPEGAEFAGIGVRRHVAFLFILSGMLSGLTGVLWGARFGTVDAVIAPDLQLQSISAAVVGGVSIFGGSGSVYGAAIGAAIFAVLQNGVQLLGFDQFWIPALLGVAILGTVLLSSRLANRGSAPTGSNRSSGRGKVVS
jgi:rhamnose transport system permease protein